MGKNYNPLLLVVNIKLLGAYQKLLQDNFVFSKSRRRGSQSVRMRFESDQRKQRQTNNSGTRIALTENSPQQNHGPIRGMLTDKTQAKSHNILLQATGNSAQNPKILIQKACWIYVADAPCCFRIHPTSCQP